jgi:hypothetical protein
MVFSVSNWMYGILVIAFLVVAGAAEYIHIAPAGSFYTVFLLVLGILVPSPVNSSAKPVATFAEPLNTAATSQFQTLQDIPPKGG